MSRFHQAFFLKTFFRSFFDAFVKKIALQLAWCMYKFIFLFFAHTLVKIKMEYLMGSPLMTSWSKGIKGFVPTLKA